MLNRMLNILPSSWIYKFLDTGIGSFAYEVGYAATRTREIEFGDYSFQMKTPLFQALLWEDYKENGCHEPVTTQAFVEFLTDNNGATVWDVGSKCGYFMMVASVIQPSANIHVFEPEEAHLRLIRKNNQLWLGGEATVNGLTMGDATLETQVKGDDYAQEYGIPDLVKIDVDGAELSVLSGMTDLLETHSPTILLELHKDSEWEQKIMSIAQLLNLGSYEYYLIKDHRNPHGTAEQIPEIGGLRTMDLPVDMLLRCISNRSPT